MKINAAWVGMSVCLLSTALVSQKVSVNYNHDESFAQYHTYAWAPSNPNQIKDSILAQPSPPFPGSYYLSCSE